MDQLAKLDSRELLLFSFLRLRPSPEFFALLFSFISLKEGLMRLLFQKGNLIFKMTFSFAPKKFQEFIQSFGGADA